MTTRPSSRFGEVVVMANKDVVSRLLRCHEADCRALVEHLRTVNKEVTVSEERAWWVPWFWVGVIAFCLAVWGGVWWGLR